MIALQYVLIQSSFCMGRGRVSAPGAPPLSIPRTTWRQITERETTRDCAATRAAKLIRPLTKKIKKKLPIRHGLMLLTANVVVSNCSSKSNQKKYWTLLYIKSRDFLLTESESFDSLSETFPFGFFFFLIFFSVPFSVHVPSFSSSESDESLSESSCFLLPADSSSSLNHKVSTSHVNILSPQFLPRVTVQVGTPSFTIHFRLKMILDTFRLNKKVY